MCSNSESVLFGNYICQGSTTYYHHLGGWVIIVGTGFGWLTICCIVLMHLGGSTSLMICLGKMFVFCNFTCDGFSLLSSVLCLYVEALFVCLLICYWVSLTRFTVNGYFFTFDSLGCDGVAVTVGHLAVDVLSCNSALTLSNCAALPAVAVAFGLPWAGIEVMPDTAILLGLPSAFTFGPGGNQLSCQ